MALVKEGKIVVFTDFDVKLGRKSSNLMYICAVKF